MAPIHLDAAVHFLTVKLFTWICQYTKQDKRAHFYTNIFISLNSIILYPLCTRQWSFLCAWIIVKVSYVQFVASIRLILHLAKEGTYDALAAQNTLKNINKCVNFLILSS